MGRKEGDWPAPWEMRGSGSQNRGRGQPSAEKGTWLAPRKGRELAKEHLYLVCAHCPKQCLAQRQGVSQRQRKGGTLEMPPADSGFLWCARKLLSPVMLQGFHQSALSLFWETLYPPYQASGGRKLELTAPHPPSHYSGRYGVCRAIKQKRRHESGYCFM